MAADPLAGFVSENESVLQARTGPWLVIAPFNFPLALAGGPAGAALVAGNTVVFKAASTTPWSGRLLADAFRDAGVPPGVFNFVTGPGGSHRRGADPAPRRGRRHLHRQLTTSACTCCRTFAQGRWPRPCIAEMGGKNAAIVSRHANLHDAATGVALGVRAVRAEVLGVLARVRRAPVFADFVAALHAATANDRRRRSHAARALDGARSSTRRPSRATRTRRRRSRRSATAGAIVHGGERLDHGDLAHGHYCAPTIARAPLDHPLWQHRAVPAVRAGRARRPTSTKRSRARTPATTASRRGSTGPRTRPSASSRTIEAGVCYANRPQGATTGAWPGYQPFGGWKGSGSTGKAGGSLYYVTQYLREQSRTRVARR